jgi:multicomponent Na+:H+ antiporter subunit E
MALSLAFLMLVWLGWSGYLKAHLVTLGVISCATVVLLMARMGVFRESSHWLRLLPRLPAFWAWLGWEVVKSNLELARIILSPRLRMSPTVVTIRALPEDRLGQATLGNCITLTPGTVTLDDHEGELLVHCITQDNATGLLEGDMNRRLAALTRL